MSGTWQKINDKTTTTTLSLGVVKWKTIICSDDGKLVAGITVDGNTSDTKYGTLIFSRDGGTTWSETPGFPKEKSWYAIAANSSYTSFTVSAGNYVYYYSELPAVGK